MVMTSSYSMKLFNEIFAIVKQLIEADIHFRLRCGFARTDSKVASSTCVNHEPHHAVQSKVSLHFSTFSILNHMGKSYQISKYHIMSS